MKTQTLIYFLVLSRFVIASNFFLRITKESIDAYRIYDALKMRYGYRTDMIKYPGRNLRSRKNFAIRRTSSRLGKQFVCYTNLPGIFRIAICYRSPTIDSFRRSSRLSCIVFVGAAIGPTTMLLRARIFLDSTPMCYGRFHILSAATRLIYPADQGAFCKRNPFS